MITYLQGKKTYILAGFAILLILANFAGLVDLTTVNTILPLLGFGSVLALRASISNLS